MTFPGCQNKLLVDEENENRICYEWIPVNFLELLFCWSFIFSDKESTEVTWMSWREARGVVPRLESSSPSYLWTSSIMLRHFQATVYLSSSVKEISACKQSHRVDMFSTFRKQQIVWVNEELVIPIKCSDSMMLRCKYAHHKKERC